MKYVLFPILYLCLIPVYFMLRNETKPKKNITEFVYSYGEKYYAAYCPNEKAAELKKALADIFGTEPEEYKK